MMNPEEFPYLELLIAIAMTVSAIVMFFMLGLQIFAQYH